MQKQVKPTKVPVAATTVQPRTQITAEMITYIDVPESYISENVITDESQIIDMYAHYNTLIPQGSMFYQETVTEQQQQQTPEDFYEQFPFNPFGY